jgi:hypothetical protein
MKKHKDYYRFTALRFLANSIALLEDIEDLKETKLYSRELKHYANKFVYHLERAVVPLENELAKNGEIEIVDEITKVVREFNKSVTNQYLGK